MSRAIDYERLKELEKKINRLERFLQKASGYPVLVFSVRDTYVDDFYDQTTESKRLRGFSQTCDLPDDLELREMVMEKIEEHLLKCKEEFNELLK